MEEELVSLVELELKRRGLVSGDITRGIYLVEPHASMIAQGHKTAILKDRDYNISDEKLMLVSKDVAYGYLQLDKSMRINSTRDFLKYQIKHRVTLSEKTIWKWDFPIFLFFIKELDLFKNPKKIHLPKGIQNFVINPEQYVEEEESSKSKSITKLTKEEYKELLKKEDYKNKPLPAKHYVNPRSGKFFVQCHLRGIPPEEYEKYRKKEIDLATMITDHSIHVDWRAKFDGVPKLVQFVVVEDSVDSYLRVMKGETDPKTNNIAKGLVIIKPSAEPTKISKEEVEKLILNKPDANKIAKYIIESKSYVIKAGDVGASPYTDAYLGTICTGTIQSGVMRPDFKEVFTSPDSDLPEINRVLFNGRWIWKAFKEPRYLWWTFKASKSPEPANPYCEIDKGNYELRPADKLTNFKKEDYTEWNSRKSDC